METTVERTAEHTVKLTIEVPTDQLTKDLDKTYRAIAREVKIPGFRPGKAPNTIIDAQSRSAGAGTGVMAFSGSARAVIVASG